MKNGTLKEEVYKELEQADQAMLQYVAEAITNYKKESAEQWEDLHPVLQEALEVSIAQADRGETLSHEEAMASIKPEFRLSVK